MDKRTEKAFLGKARHNLKNPVNAILGYSEMLIEDCEDECLDHLIPDISKLNEAGTEILTSIEEIFNDKALSDPGKSISTIAEEMEIALRTPLNTIIGYSELLLEESDKVDIDNFVSDISKITESKLSISTLSLSSNRSSEYPIIVFKGVLRAISISSAIVEIDLPGSLRALSLNISSIDVSISVPASFSLLISGIR
jgi:signal transduction histidine kinase